VLFLSYKKDSLFTRNIMKSLGKKKTLSNLAKGLIAVHIGASSYIYARERAPHYLFRGESGLVVCVYIRRR
jgi:hypothetical protein